MNKTETKLQYEILKADDNALSVIIVSAGSSTRMNGTDKQLLKIGGIPVIARTLMTFELCNLIKNIILVTREESILEMQHLRDKYMISKLSDIVVGGKSRQESVLNGFARLSENDKSVLIHDGARPLVTDEIIDAVINGLNNYSAVTCAVKVKDTIKQITDDGFVLKTLNRDELISVQTPQGVRVKEYLDAVKKAEDISKFTDDTSIMEFAGHKVFTVDGSYTNIKITTVEDISLAEKYISEVEE